MPAPWSIARRARRPKMDHPHAPASDPTAHDDLHGRAQQVRPTPELDVEGDGDGEAELRHGA
eukprot:2147525-Lingulodinium_polyedra.AAC.1